MNIRQHALRSIRSGMPARFDVQVENPGIQFLADDQEFIPFYDLGYSPRLGYYRMSALPDVPSECTNENPETIHPLVESDDDAPLYVWRDADGDLHRLGELHQAADLYNALGDLLCNFRCHPDPISEHDPAWGRNYNMARSIEEAIAFGYGDNRVAIAAAIRAAASAGRIKGASRADGRWSIPPAPLRDWLARSMEEKRGRPRRDSRDSQQPTAPNWWPVRIGHVYSIYRDGALPDHGLRLASAPTTRGDALERAERAAAQHARKASGGDKGQWVVRQDADSFIVEKVVP